jgi:glucose/mannose transport system substrate-binding protein
MDTFGLPRGAPHREGTIELLRVFGSPEGQRVFNRIKGSQPARSDVGPRTKSNVPPPPESSVDLARDLARVPTLTSLVPPTFSDAMDAALGAYARDRNVNAVLDAMDREYVRIGY